MGTTPSGSGGRPAVRQSNSDHAARWWVSCSPLVITGVQDARNSISARGGSSLIAPMRRNDPRTPLLAVLRALTPEQRAEFAAEADTQVSYLYALSICARRSPRALLAKSIADASVVMCRRYGSPVVTLDDLATMCATCAS